MPDLADVVRDLYVAPLSSFVAARKDAVTAARKADDADGAEVLAALRKPSVAAWVVNQLARHREDLVTEVLDLGAELRDAQESGDGTRVRELDKERRAVLRRAVAEGVALAKEHGQKVGPAPQAALEETLRAVLADPEAAAAATSGMLVTDLSASGFGPVDLDGAVALPDGSPSGGSTDSDAGSGITARRIAEADEELASAQAEADDATRRTASARADHEAAADREARLDQQRATLEEKLAAVRDEHASAEDELASLGDALEKAERAEALARRAVIKAQARRDRLS